MRLSTFIVLLYLSGCSGSSSAQRAGDETDALEELPFVFTDDSAVDSLLSNSDESSANPNQPITDVSAVEKRVAPKYPGDALRAGMQGNVDMKVLVDTLGNPRKALIIKSDAKTFNKPALRALMQWKFKPRTASGKTIFVWYNVPFKFRLSSR